MKRLTLFAILLTAGTSGCLTPRNDGQRGFFKRAYNRLHPNNVGGPCYSGQCGGPVAIAPPVVQQGCSTCGNGSTQSLSYGEYPSVENYGSSSSYSPEYDSGYSQGSYVEGSSRIVPNESYGPSMEMIQPMGR